VNLDQEAMRVLHDEHAAALWQVAVRSTGDSNRAHDAVQEVLLRAWRHPEVFGDDVDRARAWLLRALRHVLIDQWRARSARPETLTDTPPERGVGDDIDAAVQSLLVADALSRLTGEHRQVLLECFFRGRSVAEAASRIGVPPGTVKSRTHYALRALRLTLDEMGVGP
jgi:RNA polymerase sigma-70 factor (ECF subfamily)